MPKILHLLLDTNVFIECRPLGELDWEQWADGSAEMHLIVCRPVQREIDNQKSRGKGRVNKRARETASLFREIITGTEDYRLVRTAKPQVKLLIDPSCRPDPEAKAELGGSTDDEIVACLSAFRKTHPKADARLLTHDSGLMGTARMLSLPFIPVPDDWLLPPETTPEEKEIKHLKAEVDRLRKAEPQVQIRCLDGDGNETDSLTLELVRFDPLSEEDVLELMHRLRGRVPLKTDFMQWPSHKSYEQSLLDTALPLIDLSDPDGRIEEHTKKQYREWLKNCKKHFQKFHEKLQYAEGSPEFCFVIRNEGTRPGKDVLLSFTTKGDFQIYQPKPKTQRFPSFNNEEDPEKFYYKDGWSHKPVASVAYRCKQWRHGTGDMRFPGKIFSESKEAKVAGALECVTHAGNLSEPARKTVPVSFTITESDARENAEQLIEALP